MRVASLLLTIAAGLLPKSSDAEFREISETTFPPRNDTSTSATSKPKKQSTSMCGRENRLCPDGTYVFRDPNNGCEFSGCKPPIIYSPLGEDTEKPGAFQKNINSCPHNDIKTCPDGTSLSRDPQLGCDFPECELLCCDPLKAPSSIQEAKCCGATGKWVASIGNGRFKCNGVISSGPDFPAPFGEPCSVDCDSFERKSLCRTQAEHGCFWLGRKQCIHENNIQCEKLTVKRICSRIDKCEWKRNRCGRCPQPDPLVPCDEEFQPVTCRRGCVYDNMCNARAAGQKARQCKRFCQSNSDCNEKDVCYEGTCVKQTGNTCDGFRGAICPTGEKCVPTPCPPGVMDSCGGQCIKDR